MPGPDTRRPGRLSDEQVAHLRELANLDATQIALLKQVLRREEALTVARQERDHYTRVCKESAIRWAIPLVLAAALSVILWTGKLWLLAMLEAVKDVHR